MTNGLLTNAADTEPETESDDEFQICNICNSEGVIFLFIFLFLGYDKKGLHVFFLVL